MRFLKPLIMGWTAIISLVWQPRPWLTCKNDIKTPIIITTTHSLRQLKIVSSPHPLINCLSPFCPLISDWSDWSPESGTWELLRLRNEDQRTKRVHIVQVNKCYKDKLKYLINYNIVVHKIVFIVGSSSCDPQGPMRGGQRCGDWLVTDGDIRDSNTPRWKWPVSPSDKFGKNYISWEINGQAWQYICHEGWVFVGKYKTLLWFRGRKP